MKEQTQKKAAPGCTLLLLDDIEGLGRKGEIVVAKPGHVRNFLIPNKKAVIADNNALRIQERLRVERAKQAQIDKVASEQLASQVNGLTLSTHVKVDPDGRMYGSVAAADIVEILERENIHIERRFVALPKPIKETGLHPIELRLKEGIMASFKLKVIPEGMEDLPELTPNEPPLVEAASEVPAVEGEGHEEA
ncbi:MAG: 50S ribosomal protein L9 [Parachlamydiales bacterium]